MTHLDTDALIERLLRDPVAHKDLIRHAARFFGNSPSEQRHGLDAEHLVNEVLTKVTELGTLHEQPNPIAYIKRAITNLGLSAKDRYQHYRMSIEPLEVPDHETDFTERIDSSVDLREAVEDLPPRARRVATAKLENPNLNINEIAAHLDVSRDTVRRGYHDMRADPALRHLAPPEVAPEHTTAPPPQEQP